AEVLPAQVGVNVLRLPARQVVAERLDHNTPPKFILLITPTLAVFLHRHPQRLARQGLGQEPCQPFYRGLSVICGDDEGLAHSGLACLRKSRNRNLAVSPEARQRTWTW